MGQFQQDSIFWVEVDRIVPNPYQPRREFDEEKLKELSDSIRMYGLLQPITVTRREDIHEDGSIRVTYELISGERRLRASKLAGLSQIPVIIHTAARTDEEKFELAIIENVQREDLSLLDRAYAFDRLAREFKYSKADIGRKVGKSREYVSNTIRVLSLPEYILEHIACGHISDGHTRPLLMLSDKPDLQRAMAEDIVAKRMTVRDAEKIAQRMAQEKVRKTKHKFAPELLTLEKTLSEKLNTRVRLEVSENGGRVVINFFSSEDLKNLLDFMHASEMQGAVEGVLPQSAPALHKENLSPDEAREEREIAFDALEQVMGDAADVSAEDDTDTASRSSTPDDDLYSLKHFSL